jgi:hypothetical protein
MTEQHFSKFFAKLLVDSDENHDSPNLFSLHKTNQDQSPKSAPPTVVPTQDQAVETGVFDTPFEEAVPLEDELASLLDDIDD